MVNGIRWFFQTYKDSITATVSVLAFFLSLYIFLKARKDAKIQAVLQYKSKLREWADDAIDSVSEAMYLIRINPAKDPNFFNKRHELMWRISSLIDRGRLFLPNIDFEAHGQQKEPSYRGFRHPVLDWLVLAHDLCKEINYVDPRENEPLAKKFEKSRRQFVSEVQMVLDSRAEIAVLGNLFLVDPQQSVPNKRGYAEYLEIRNWLSARNAQRAGEPVSNKAVSSAM